MGRLRLRIGWTEIAVRLALDPINERVGDVAATVKAHVNDHRLLARHILVGFTLKLDLVAHAHGCQMQVTNLSIALFLDGLAKTLDAVAVVKVIPFPIAHDLILHGAGAQLVSVGVDEELELAALLVVDGLEDRKSTRLNSSHSQISY